MADIDGDSGNNTLNGTNSADLINGFGGNDEIFGNGGNDVINGGTGSDTIFGGSGNDTLNGDGGNDFLDGGTGTNTLTGGANMDTFAISVRGTQYTTITDFVDGADKIDVSGWNISSIDQLLPYMTEVAGDVYITTEWANFNSGDNETLRINNIDLADLTAADFIFRTSTDSLTISVTTSGDSDLFGGAGNDIITGTGGRETVNAGAGNDLINVGLDTNFIRTGTGSDTVEISFRGPQYTTIADFDLGNDIIDLSSWGIHSFDQMLPYLTEVAGDVYFITEWANFNAADNETLRINDTTIGQLSASDFMFNTSTAPLTINITTSGDTDVFGGAGDDDITGSGGRETVNAGAGNDTINMGIDTNFIRTGIGSDTVEISFRGPQFTTIADFDSGNDIIDLSDWGISTFDQMLPYLTEVAGDVYFITEWSNFNAADNETLRINDITIAELSASDFTFRTSTAPLTINITTSGDSDVFGGAGDDDITGSGGRETVNAGAGDDTINMGIDTNFIRTGTGSDTVEISFRGSQYTTIADFEVGNDIVNLVDWFVGSYDQLIPFLSQVGDDVVFSTQWQNFSANTNEALQINNVTLNALDASYFEFNSSTVDRVITNSSSGSTTLFGGLGDDEISGGSGRTTISAGFGDDILNGGSGNDVLIGGAGADELNGDAGFDYASYAGSVNRVNVNLLNGATSLGHSAGDTFDSIEGLIGSRFGDDLRGNNIDNILNGESGNDTLIGFNGDDDLYGGIGRDILNGGDGADFIDGGAGVDQVRYNGSTVGVNVDLGAGTASGGHAAGDTLVNIENLFGSNHGDDLRGDSGNNKIFGHTGDDILSGGGGIDKLFGGTGADSFVLAAGEGRAFIMDFEDDVDQLDVSAYGFATLADALMNLDQVGSYARFRVDGDVLLVFDTDMNDLMDDIVI